MRGIEIRINILSPGTIITPAYDELFGSELDHVLEQAKNGIPLGRVGQVEEISNAVMFLASNESSYMNGVELFVDGGIAQVLTRT